MYVWLVRKTPIETEEEDQDVLTVCVTEEIARKVARNLMIGIIDGLPGSRPRRWKGLDFFAVQRIFYREVSNSTWSVHIERRKLMTDKNSGGDM